MTIGQPERLANDHLVRGIWLAARFGHEALRFSRTASSC